MADNLTAKQGYLAMVSFLKRHYARTKSDDIGSLLGDLQLLDSGGTADPAAWDDWIASVEDGKRETRR